MKLDIIVTKVHHAPTMRKGGLHVCKSLADQDFQDLKIFGIFISGFGPPISAGSHNPVNPEKSIPAIKIPKIFKSWKS
ncbi:MAG: hypothetical protein IT270_08015 [Saprospiraceae bacterium]|nr:hypothetical protein [Saprospiraceae bacterium]